MVNIAISLAFILSALLKPGQILLDLVIGLPIVGTLPVWERLFVLAVFDLWLPTVLIYLALRLAPYASRFRPTEGEQGLLVLTNLVLISYAGVRLYASTIPGGGIGLLVGLAAPFTSWIALLASGIVLIKILGRKPESISSDPQNGASNITWRDKLSSLTAKEKLAISIYGFLPIIVALGYLSIGSNSPIVIGYKNHSRMNELCSTAGEKILRVLKDVDGLYWDNQGGMSVQISGVGFKPYYRGQYQGYGGSGDPFSWANSKYFLFIEKPYRPRGKDDLSTHKYIRYTKERGEEYVDGLLSKVGVIRTKLTNEEDEKYGLESYEISIRILATGEITALNRFTYNKKARQVCGQLENNGFCEDCFVLRAIDWQFH